MTSPTTQIAEKLLTDQGYPLLSIYMPTHRAGSDIWQDPIRLKNLVRAAERDLEAGGTARSKIDALLQPLIDLLEDRKFWQYQSDGLALFRSSTGLEEFRLPCPVPELCVVGDRYHLKPLLLSLADEQSFYVLAISQNAVRLFRGSPYGMEEIHGLDFPAGMEPKAGGKTVPSYAAGGAVISQSTEPDHKAEIADYSRHIDRTLLTVVKSGELVILAAVDYVAAIYRDTSAFRGLAAESISGSPDLMPPDQIFEKALPIARTHFDQRYKEDEGRFFSSAGTGRTLDDPVETIKAARQGRIDTLFVAIGVHVWGEIDGDGEVRISSQQQPADQDLLNAALIDTWKTGGRVHAVTADKMPGGRQIAAITRY